MKIVVGFGSNDRGFLFEIDYYDLKVGWFLRFLIS